MNNKKKPWDNIFKDKNNIWELPDPFFVSFLEEVPSNSIVLDLGCGCGRHTLLFSADHHYVIGIDESEIAINVTKQKVEEQKYSSKILKGYFSNIPLKTNSVNVILSGYSLNHGKKSDILEYFCEINRVLEKCGSICLIISAAGDYREGIGKKLEENTYLLDQGPEAGIIHHYATEEFLRQCLEFTYIIEIKKDVKTFSQLENIYKTDVHLKDHSHVLNQSNPLSINWMVKAIKK